MSTNEGPTPTSGLYRFRAGLDVIERWLNQPAIQPTEPDSQPITEAEIDELTRDHDTDTVYHRE